MGYNTSRACVNRHLRYLQDMAEAKTTITWPASDAEVFARKLREAMAAAKKYPEFAQLHNLQDFYRLRPRSGWVEAEYIGPMEATVRVYKPKHLRVEEAINSGGVVGSCIRFAVKANELHFPNAVLTEEEKEVVFNWGLTESPQWRLINHDNAGVTMTRKGGVDKTFLWKPREDPPNEP